MNQNAYPGREYAFALQAAKIRFDIFSIGGFPEINAAEEDRCGGMWRPIREEKVAEKTTIFRYKSLQDTDFLEYLARNTYDLGIQGGTGIIKQALIDSFRFGIINFHPGDLPKYRGCSAPEWQILEGQPVISTCHFIDPGIDTGKILKKKKLSVSMASYEHMRASVYPETAKFLVEIVTEILGATNLLKEAAQQDEAKANYRKYIGDTVIADMRSRMFENSGVTNGKI